MSRNKIEYMECHFSNNKLNDTTNVKIREHIMKISKFFKFLRSIIQENRVIDKDITHRIQVG